MGSTAVGKTYLIFIYKILLVRYFDIKSLSSFKYNIILLIIKIYLKLHVATMLNMLNLLANGVCFRFSICVM